MTEKAVPLSVRRLVSFSRAVYDGKAEIEGTAAVRAEDASQAEEILARGEIPVLVDPEDAVRESFHPDVLVDAIMAKRNVGTRKADAPLVIALGPGFTAGVDCDAVIETQRGPALGTVIRNGGAAPNTGIPGDIGGATTKRLLRAAAGGIMHPVVSIGDIVERGEVVAYTGNTPVYAQLSGVVRGLLQEGAEVSAGLKIGDVDPRGVVAYCFQISDKAHQIGRGVLEAIKKEGPEL